jgi:radical SAM superfamily enzyme YgiQ (UPF0313 family)
VGQALEDAAYSAAFEVLLISTYELGRQPFGLASPAAWLRRAGFEVRCADLAVQELPREALVKADLVAFFVPMHTATRLCVPIISQVKEHNPGAHICCYGLYAPANAGYLRGLGVETLLGGEFETGLVELCRHLARAESISHKPPLVFLDRQAFLVPDRVDLPDLSHYARLHNGTASPVTTGYTEASRGCKHHCRHCPVVPVYRGKFRVVQQEVVLQDVRQQVAAGAEHITFGDADFFNGIGHAVPLVEALHRQHPDLTYDVTIKVQHLLDHAEYLPLLRATGCAFVTTAVESIDDQVLEILDKGHTRADFVRSVLLCRRLDLILNPTLVAFTPWTLLDDYLELLALLVEMDLVDQVAPIQLGIRLLIPAASKLLELEQVQSLIGPFDEVRLSYVWEHPDPRMDQLHHQVMALIEEGTRVGASRRAIFTEIWNCAHLHREAGACGAELHFARPAATIPFLTEPWYC